MSNNLFSGKRLALLCRQHVIHNSEFLILATVAYMGVIFIVLSIVQTGNNFRAHNLDNFQGFLLAFVSVFGVLYAGHSFPAFRSKESTINYLMVPASALEKFVFEFINRIGLTILLLPLLYWATFHLQGYFFTIFTDEVFRPIGPQYLVKIDMPDPEYPLLIFTLISAAIVLGLVLAFTGAAIFNKQPLVKSLFAVAVIVMFFIGYSYAVVEHLGVGRYNPPDTMLLLPMEEMKVLQSVTLALIITTAIMLFVAFRKLKEREV